MASENQVKDQKITKFHGLGIDVLWVLVVLAAFLFFTSLVPLPPNDFWWHLKIGQLIYSNHAIPTTNLFAWTLPADQPFIYAAWLAELLFYLLYLVGKLPLIIFLRTILIGLAVWLIALESKRRSGSWRITALTIALLALMITNNLPVRTQMFAWIPFVVTYLTLKRFTEGRIRGQWLFLCPLCMLIWVNVHGSFILGLVLIGGFFVGQIISRLFKQPDSLSWQQIGSLGGVGVITTMATLVNPRFIGIVDYTMKLLTDPSSQKLIEEWQSPTPQGLANIIFYISILIFVSVLAITKYRLTATEIILTIGFLWLAWSGQRYVIWYAMVTAPILARMIADMPMKTPAFIPQTNWLNLALAWILFAPVVVVSPWLVERLPLPNTYWNQVLRGSSAGPLISAHTPVAAAEYLRNHPGGNLFNEMGYGSYLDWAVPQQKVFVDPRVELYPYEQWMDYIYIQNGRKDYEQLLAKYKVNRLLLDKSLQKELIKILTENPAWSLEYEDTNSQIWELVLAH